MSEVSAKRRNFSGAPTPDSRGAGREATEDWAAQRAAYRQLLGRLSGFALTVADLDDIIRYHEEELGLAYSWTLDQSDDRSSNSANVTRAA